jgi:type III pantothenate kinase
LLHILCYNIKKYLKEEVIMLLADIGNTRVHIYDGDRVIHLTHQEAIKRYAGSRVLYITVKHQLKSKLSSLKNWVDISDRMILKGSYSTMGVDRKALCLSYKTGIFVSAGSAITVDIVEDGEYMGGFLLLGLSQYIKSYGLISPALKCELNRDIDLDRLPKSTIDGISYGIVSSIKSIISQHQKDKKLYISGGDGEFLSPFFDNAIFDEKLIFFGMRSILRER